jgi:hypothetical protein
MEGRGAEGSSDISDEEPADLWSSLSLVMPR